MRVSAWRGQKRAFITEYSYSTGSERSLSAPLQVRNLRPTCQTRSDRLHGICGYPDLYIDGMKRIPLALVASLVLALTAASASAAPGALTWKPKKPAAGKRVTVTGKGFKKRAKYKITVNDIVYKRGYQTSKHGKVKFSFLMPQIERGGAIFVGVKVGKVYRIAEVFISDAPPAAEPKKTECEDSPYLPYPDGSCPDFSFDNGLDEEEPVD